LTATSLLTAALENALNRYIQMDEEAVAGLDDLENRAIGLSIINTPIELFMILENRYISVRDSFEGDVDAYISATPLALIKSGQTGDNSQAFFRGEMHVTGDTAVGHQFQQLLKNVDIDWEEQLSRITGDVLAHSIGHTLRSSMKWARQAGETLQQDTAEYLQEESGMLPRPEEVTGFLSEVDELRDATARLEARIRRLADGAE
jgi:ubiquinone biosynthesis protein UbiJ